MPTFETTDVFRKDFASLDVVDQGRFKKAVQAFVADLESRDHGFRPGLRVKRVQGAAGVYEMTWAPDGRATFQYGEELRSGEPHVVWRRVGTHDVFARP